MSTSDAAESQLSGVGETGTPLRGATQAARTAITRYKSHQETLTRRHSRPSGIRREGTHRGDEEEEEEEEEEETPSCCDSVIQIPKSDRSRNTSCLLQTLSGSQSPVIAEPRLKERPDSCLRWSPDSQRTLTEGSSSRINGPTLPADDSSVARDSLLRERIPSPSKDKADILIVCYDLEITRDLSINHSFSNDDSGLHKRCGLCRFPCGSQPKTTDIASGELEEATNHCTTSENDPAEQSDTPVVMLSSTVVTVLAPHWSSRLRRTKRFEGPASSEAQGTSDVNCAQEHFQTEHGVDRMFTDGSRSQHRFPLLASRRNTVGWSTNSSPDSLDYESKRRMIQSVSVDVNSGRTDNKKTDAGSSRTVAMAASPVSPHNPQTSHQGGLSVVNSKPTTSSLLFSLRRLNYGSNANAAPSVSDTNQSSVGQDGKLFTTHVSQPFGKSNEQERLNPRLSSSSMSYRTTEAGTARPPPLSPHGERDAPKTRYVSSLPLNKITEDTRFSQQPLAANMAQCGLSRPTQPYLSRQAPERPQNWGDSSKNGNIYSESSTPSPRHSPGDLNLIKMQGGTLNLNKINAEYLFDQKSDRCVKQQYGSALNDLQQAKPKSLPGVMIVPKISRLPGQPTLSHAKDLGKRDVGNGAFAAHASELPPTSLKPPSSAPTESSGLYKNSRGPLKANTPTLPHGKDSLKFAKQSLSLDGAGSYQHGPFQPQPVASASSSHLPKFASTATSTPLGFERSYAPIPKPFHANTASNLAPTLLAFSKTSYGTAPSPFSGVTGCASSASPASPLRTPPITPVITSHLPTPPTTPTICSPVYSESPSPKEKKILSNSPEKETQKPRSPGKGKRVRRVTWEDSVQDSESAAPEKADPSPSQMSALSPSRSPRTIKAPSIFSFLRSSSATTNTTPSSTTSDVQIGKRGKYRSLTSDFPDFASRQQEKSSVQRPADTLSIDQGRREATTNRHERTLSAESGAAQYRSSGPLSLPPDFSNGYKLRYSSPPYSTLVSTRTAQGDTKNIPARISLFPKNTQLNYNSHIPLLRSHSVADLTSPMSEPPPSSTTSPKPLTSPFQERVAVREADQINNNNCKKTSQDQQNGQVLLVDNRLSISSRPLEAEKVLNSPPTFVTETLVYSLKSKVNTGPAAPKNTRPGPLQHAASLPISVETKLNQQSDTELSKTSVSRPLVSSNQSSSGSSSTDTHSLDDEGSKRMKTSVMGKSRFFSVENNTEQNQKKSRFVLKKSVSTPNSNLSRSDSDRSNKTNKKMDQVLNKLRQTFSTKRSEDDSSPTWKWRRGSQTSSVSELSDITNICDTTTEKSQTREEPGKGEVLRDNDRDAGGKDRWTQNKYTLIPSLAVENTMVEDPFSPKQIEQSVGIENMSGRKNKAHLTIQSPNSYQFDYYKDDTPDGKSSHQFLSCRDTSPSRGSNPSSGYPSQFRKSTPSPRSPFSPFSSLSPHSPFPSPDVTDDSVFYSPKLQRRRDTPSPCEPVEGISLVSSRRSRASTGPPSASPVKDEEQLASSYADLKYGIEPGKSFSVSSVLSSRPSGPGRISTGSRFMSMGDLSASTYGGPGKDFDTRSVSPNWGRDDDCRPGSGCTMSYFPSDPGKVRSRSLPRSLTRRLASWTSGGCTSTSATTSKSPSHWSPTMNSGQFAWDTEGPPTPPPTPPLSPVGRRLSKPPSLSMPTFSSPPGEPDSQSPRGHLPSRCYISSLSTFEESSDSSSDTTTDDEYYLETGEDEEKETEL